MTEQEKKQIHAEAIYKHNRICCVCRDKLKRHIQIHHIDGDNNNDDPTNLSVLCLECHNDTLIVGSFSRKLSPEIVKLYRDEWIEFVAKQRSTTDQEDYFKISKKISIKENQFIAQLRNNNILPINASFYFRDFFFETEFFPTIVVSSNETNSENGDRYRSILKAFLLCSLGYLTPSKYLFTNTLRLADSKREVIIHPEQKIKIPDWYIANHQEISPLHIVGVYHPNLNEIHYLLKPILTTNIDYSNLLPILSEICSELIEKHLEI
jgi:hypothetical protein